MDTVDTKVHNTKETKTICKAAHTKSADDGEDDGEEENRNN